jgi:hypothetical protein
MRSDEAHALGLSANCWARSSQCGGVFWTGKLYSADASLQVHSTPPTYNKAGFT